MVFQGAILHFHVGESECKPSFSCAWMAQLWVATRPRPTRKIHSFNAFSAPRVPGQYKNVIQSSGSNVEVKADGGSASFDFGRPENTWPVWRDGWKWWLAHGASVFLVFCRPGEGSPPSTVLAAKVFACVAWLLLVPTLHQLGPSA